MPRRFSISRLLFFVPVLALLLAWGCSFRSYGSPFVLQGDLRSLSDLDQFALAITGGQGDSLTSAVVGNRNLSCLGLSGLVIFPLTLAQLTTGVPVAISHGSYHFTVVGFEGAAAAPSSVADMYQRSPSLKAYKVAEADADTVANSTVILNSTYAAGSTLDQLVECPPVNSDLHALANNSGQLVYLKGRGMSWELTNIPGAASVTLADFYVDGSAKAHLIYREPGDITAGYATNAGGTFTTSSSGVFLGGVTGVAITHVGNSPYFLIGYGLASYDLELFQPSWSTLGFASAGSPEAHTDPFLAAGPENSFVAVHTNVTSAVEQTVSLRNGLGNWSVEGNLNSFGAFPCVQGSFDGSGGFDSNGKYHLGYFCKTAGGDGVGYATNVGGFQRVGIAGLEPDISGADFVLDPAGGKHVAYFNAFGDVNYAYSPAGSVSFSPLQNVMPAANPNGKLRLAAVSATEAHILFLESTRNDCVVRHATNAGGSWQATSQSVGMAGGCFLHRSVWAR